MQSRNRIEQSLAFADPIGVADLLPTGIFALASGLMAVSALGGGDALLRSWMFGVTAYAIGAALVARRSLRSRGRLDGIFLRFGFLPMLVLAYAVLA